MKKPFYKSKKFWALISGCAVVFGEQYLGLDSLTTTKIIGVISAYMIGQGVADSAGK